LKNIRNLVEIKHLNLIILFEHYHPGQGDMTKQEFDHFVLRIDKHLTTTELDLIFNHFDEDKMGSISMDKFIHQIEGKHVHLTNIDIKCHQR
jgi:Ca2+-binding EF-hand superfamily protein